MKALVDIRQFYGTNQHGDLSGVHLNMEIIVIDPAGKARIANMNLKVR